MDGDGIKDKALLVIATALTIISVRTIHNYILSRKVGIQIVF
jgi:hypothetical protein